MMEISYKEYYNKVLGAWIGRVAGDFVGVPVELKSYDDIKERYGDITDYPEPIDLNHVNDDEMYEIIALIALEKYGIDITAKEIAQEWKNLLSREDYVFTAEKIALNNLKANIKADKLTDKAIFTGKHTQDDAFLLLNRIFDEDIIPEVYTVYGVKGIIEHTLTIN